MKYLAVIILIFSISVDSLGQNQLIRIKSNDSNRVILYFSSKPNSYKSELSEDKRKVILKIAKCTPNEDARKAYGKGYIQDVYVLQTNSDTEVNIILKDKLGYTANILPYSKALIVEVFRWSDLKASDDHYRSGLLALESGLEDIAIKNFVAALSLGNYQASAYLGLIYLQKGQIGKASEYLRIAAIRNANIDDIYAGISQILKMQNNFDKAIKFADIFKMRSGLDHYLDLPIESANDTTNYTNEQLAQGDYFDDILALEIKSDTSSADTLNKQFAKLFEEATTDDNSKSLKETELIPSWITVLIAGIFAFVLILVIIIAILYYKWRKKQKEKVAANKTESKFDSYLQENYHSGSTISSRAVSAYKQQEDAAISQNISETTEKSNESVTELKNKLFDTLDKLSEKQENDKESKIEFENTPKSPKIELALHLQKEQQKLKQRNIEAMTKTKLPTDVKKMTEFAKKLGIEKGSIEVKKALDDILSNKEYMAKLSEKFKTKK